MWKQAIEAIQNGDKNWIRENNSVFREFFKKENILEQGKLSENALSEHYKARLFKMFISSSLDGLELDLPTGAKWIENASRLDGNWGWLLAIGVGGAYFTHYITEDLRNLYFKPEEALVAGSGKPSGQAVRSTNQWEVDGSWDYCSGSEQASFFTAVTRKDSKNIAFILPRDQVRIERNWNAIGLNLTCSHKIIADSAQVSENHFFDLSEKPESSSYPLSSYPFDLFARACFVPVVVGLLKSIRQEVRIVALQKKETWQKFQPGKYHKLDRLLSEADKQLRELETTFYSSLSTSWENHKRGKMIDISKLQRTSLELSKFCYSWPSQVIPMLGMQAVRRDHPIQECWRDLQTAYQHMIFRSYN